MKTLRLTLALAALGLIGCAETEELPPETGVSLQRAQSCEDLEHRLKLDALAKMNAAIDAQIDSIRRWGDPWGGYDNTGEELGAVSSSATSGAGGGSSGAPPPAHSETNTQVAGVDEADIVKTDGNYLYVLHGTDLAILSAWPASGLTLSSTTAVEGQPLEMFVAGNRLVVYSNIYGDAVYNEAGIVGRDDGYGYYYYPSLTKVTVFALAGAQTQPLTELYFEGSYLSSRRIDDKVRTVLSGGYYSPIYQLFPTLPYEEYPQSHELWIQLYEQLRQQNIQTIQRATLRDLIPRRFVRAAGKLSEIAPSCESYYVPPPGSTADGLTQVQSFDIDSPELGIAETQIVGAAQTVYANAESLYLAGASWEEPMMGASLDDTPVSVSRTLLHKFDLTTDPFVPVYRASGAVPGRLHNQFALDERQGVLRLATSDTLVSWETFENVNHVFTLGERSGHLAITGRLENLAPGETIYSVRFVEDRGYVVTFRQVDPLFVIDLADPEEPTVLAELKIPGFSEYMHPLEGGSHLLTIGRDGTDDGQVLDVALQIFDVTNASSPKLVHKHVLPAGYSEAEYNHKAFTLYNGVLAVPAVRYDSSYGFAQSSLELFDISVAGGIVPRGSIDHTPFFESIDPTYCYYYGYGVRRGVFIEDHVYAISEGGVTAHQLANLTSPVASVALPPVAWDCGYYE